MDYLDIQDLVNTDPVVQALLEAPLPLQLGYVGLDGHPRTVPVSYIWNGKALVFATPPFAYKVKAIEAHPQVSFTVNVADDEIRAKVAAQLGPTVASYTPLIMLGRGTATIEVKPGVPQEHVEASRRLVNDDAELREWERVKRAATDEMAVVTIKPTHLTVCDFITRFPPPAEHEKAAHSES